MFGIDDAIIAAGVSAAGSFFGQQSANETNMQLAAENRVWQERMSGTAHQREVRDLIAAGLNPILSVNRSGASTPGGNVAVVQSPTAHAVTSGVDAYKSAVEAQKTKQAMKIKAPAETGAGMVDQGLSALQAGARAAGEGAAAVVTAASKVAESASGSTAAAVEKISDVAKEFGVRLSEVIESPSKFVSSLTTSAGESRRTETDFEKSVRFKGNYDKVMKDISQISNRDDRAAARKQYLKQITR